jgi:DNA repair exonuclease SbcCD ATPase subunit
MGEMEDNIYELYNDEIDSISDRYSNLFDQLENYQDRIRDYRDSLETIKDMYSLLGVATIEDNRAMNDSIRKTYQAEAKGIQNEIDLLKARREELDKANKSLGVSTDEQGRLIEGLVSDIKELENVGDTTIMEDSAKAYSQKLQDQIDEIDQQVHEKQMELISLASDYLNAIKD